MLKNLTVAQKIVGLSVTLLSLMLAAAIYSWLQQRRVHDAANDLATALEPLSREAAAVETNTLEQALMLERAIRHQSADDADPAQADSEIARFRTLVSSVDGHVQASQQLVTSALERSRVIGDAVRLARVEPEIETLAREHTAYVTAALALYDAHKTAKLDPARIRALAEQVSLQEDRVDAALDRITEKLATASDDEAGQLSGREAKAYIVSAENLALAIIAFSIGTLVSSIVTRRMIKPVRALISGAEQISSGNLDVNIEVRSRDEIGRLAGAFQHMIGELRTKERIKSTFGKYMDPRVVDRLLASDGQSSIAGGEKRVMTVFFSDLEGFSTISESLTAAGLVNLINHYLTLASEPIVREQGVIDKYIGDAVMAFWGAPFYEGADHARRACLAALAQQQQLIELRRALPDILGIRRNLPDMNVRIGLCTGDLIVGSIGSNISKSFTVMGDTVNTASRLEGANKQFGTRILIDGTTRDMVSDAMETRELDLIGVVGKFEPVRVYELLGERGKVEGPRLAARDVFESALAAYRRGDWDKAAQHFQQALTLNDADKAAKVFLERVGRFRETPPVAGWDGIWRLTAK
jgi:adenylate cyclase